MAVTDTLNTLIIELSERNEFLEARILLKVQTATLLDTLQKFEYIKNKGSFDTIPEDLKQAMLRWEAAYKACKDTLMNDSELVEIYQWEE